MGDPVLAQESCTLTAQALLARKKQLAQTCCLLRFPYVSHASVRRAVYLYQLHRPAASSGDGLQQEDNGPHTIGAAQHLLVVVVVPWRVVDPGGERVDADRYPPWPRGRASRAWPRRRCRGTGAYREQRAETDIRAVGQIDFGQFPVESVRSTAMLTCFAPIPPASGSSTHGPAGSRRRAGRLAAACLRSGNPPAR